MPDRDSVTLTLRLDRRVVEAAKRYAAEHGTTVSQRVEERLREVAPPESAERAAGGDGAAGPPSEAGWIERLDPVTRTLVERGPGRPVSRDDYRAYLERTSSRRA